MPHTSRKFNPQLMKSKKPGHYTKMMEILRQQAPAYAYLIEDDPNTKGLTEGFGAVMRIRVSDLPVDAQQVIEQASGKAHP